MSARTTLVAAAGLALAAVLWLLWSGSGDGAPSTTPAGARPDESAPPPAATAEPEPETTRREVVPAAAPRADEDSTEEPPAERFAVRGRVLDVAGTPVAGVAVHARGSREELAESDGTGRFEVRIPVDASGTFLVAEGVGWSSVRQSLVTPGNREREHLLVAARAFDLGGIVVDGDGSPLAGASVLVEIGDSALRDFPLPLDMTRKGLVSTETDEHGHFALQAAPCPAGATIVARQPGYAAGQTPAPRNARQDLYIVLRREAKGAVISGVVLLHDHRPAEGAVVRFGYESVQSGRDGAFELPLPSSAEPDQPLVAGMEGQGLALLPHFGEQIAAARPAAPPPVTLVLAEERLHIAGRVVGADGEGRAGWNVALVNGTEVSRHGTPPVLAEGLGGGATEVATEADGSFRLDNLLPRDYELRAYDPETLLAVFSGPVAAGTEDVELRVAADLTYPRVRGVVTSRRGVPLAGVQVVPGLILHQTEWGSSWDSGTAATTDELGVFEITDFPREHVHLDIGGESVVPQRFEIGPGQDVENLRLTVAQRCHFRLEVQGADLDGLSIELRDRDGQRLSIHSFRARMSSSTPRKALEQGHVPVSAVSEDAVELLVFRDGEKEPVARQPVTLSTERVNELHLVLP